MRVENFDELLIILFKYIILIVLTYSVIRFLQYLNENFLKIIPKLSKFWRNTLIVILIILMVLLKLLSFDII